MLCWIAIIGERLHDSDFILSLIILNSDMHLQSRLMMMMMISHNILVLFNAEATTAYI